MPGNTTYDVHTNLPPDELDRLSMIIFAKWLQFATGGTALGGKALMYPTGRYAASIQWRRTGVATVAVFADERYAPEARWLEEGHGAVDLKQKLRWGQAYPMHRESLGRTAAGAPRTLAGLRRTGQGMIGGRPLLWATARAADFSGMASIGPNSPPDSWIIPAMAAYHPAQTLAAMARGLAGA